MDSAVRGNPEQLLRLACGGDGDALALLLEGYRRYLKLLAQLQIDRRLQGKANASDLVQETSLQAHRVFGQFRGLSALARIHRHGRDDGGRLDRSGQENLGDLPAAGAPHENAHPSPADRPANSPVPGTFRGDAGGL